MDGAIPGPRKIKAGNLRLLSCLTMAMLGACALIEAANTPPLLGRIDAGTYSHPKGAYACPLPTVEQGFVGAVEITDAGKVEETVKRVIPLNERRPWDPVLKDHVVSSSYKALGVVLFEDSQADRTRLEIGYRRLRPEEDADTVYTSGYGGGNYGLLLEADRRRGDRRYGMAVAQLPYWPRGDGAGYAGVDLWASFLTGDQPAPSLDVLFNMIDGEWHYWFLLRNSALEFVPDGVNPKDLEAVYAALKADPSVSKTMESRLWALVAACELNMATAPLTAKD